MLFTGLPLEGMMNTFDYSPIQRGMSIRSALRAIWRYAIILVREICKMFEQLEKIEKRYREIEEKMAQPEVATDMSQVQALARERAGLEEMVSKYRKYKKAARELEDVKTMDTLDTLDTFT